ncbi:BMP family lipoprotein [Aneurinibacillus tyrosinisolvens]|uniref:BMP family lipoprotein n=1 Tax=Aneurinibacillus tyrosinisolvens TaxID=1443435 RepID=UPI00063EFE78|nr:BMP family protein [Aneurinibacillus tyrosinisolvens]
MAKKRIFLTMIALLLVMATVLAGCGGGNKGAEQKQPQNGGAGESAQKGKDFKVGMVTDVGGVDDNSFNQSAWEGLKKAKGDLGMNADYLQSKSATDYEPNFNEFAQSKTNLIWGIGYKLEKDIKKTAAANPDTHFAIVDHTWGPDTPKNIVAVTFKEEEGSFLMGVIAAKMTKTKKIGFLGGAEFDLIKKFEYGYRAGVASVDPSIKVISNYAGDFNKPDKGKTFANTMYGQGVDIIYHASGQTGDGVFTEAKDQRKNGKNVWVIGVDKDQSFLGPDVTLSSMVKRVDVAVYDVTKAASEGTFDGGQTKVFGLKEDGVAPADTTNKNVPADVLKIVDDYKQKIIKGDIKVPATEADFKKAFPQG